MKVFSRTGIFLTFSVLFFIAGNFTLASAAPNPTGYDLDGDGKADIVWRNASGGIVSAWLMNGETIASNGLLGSIDSEWQIAGVGDVNANGRADIIWRNSTSGVVAVWLMDGLTITSTGFPGRTSTDWEIHAVGDVNGDRKADFVWRNTINGAVAIWLMNGITIASSGFPGGVPLEWQIAGVGDVNADGKADVIWHSGTSGTVAVWLMDGLTITSTGFPGSTSTDFVIAGVGDMDGNSKSDIVWRNTTDGVVAVWLMNGAAIGSSGFLGGVPTDWGIAQVSDVDGDGNADIIWRKSTSGEVGVWIMNGLDISSVGFPGNTTTNNTSTRTTSNDGSGQPALLTPSAGSTLSGTTATFTWTANGAALTDWSLRIGNSSGDSNIYNSGNLPSRTLATTASGLPTNGWPIWVRLQWRNTEGTWSTTDVQYTASGKSSPQSPTPSGGGTSPSSSAPGYYVSTAGNDANAGTQSAPFRTIKRGMGLLKPGNTLFIRGGTYWENLQSHAGTKFPSGTSWSTPVKVAAFNGEQVLLKGTIVIGFANPPTQYVIFDGINIDARYQSNGIAVNGGSHHIRFQNLEIQNPDVNGVELTNHNGKTTNIELVNLNIHDTGRSLKGHGMYIQSSNNLIDGCDLHDNYKYGLQIYNGYNYESNFNIVKNNDVYRNGLGFGGSGGMTIGGDGNLIENNRVHDQIRGISLFDGYPRNSKVRNNTVWNHSGAGILNGGTNTTIENNTAYNNVPNYYP